MSSRAEILTRLVASHRRFNIFSSSIWPIGGRLPDVPHSGRAETQPAVAFDTEPVGVSVVCGRGMVWIVGGVSQVQSPVVEEGDGTVS